MRMVRWLFYSSLIKQKTKTKEPYSYPFGIACKRQFRNGQAHTARYTFKGLPDLITKSKFQRVLYTQGRQGGVWYCSGFWFTLEYLTIELPGKTKDARAGPGLRMNGGTKCRRRVKKLDQKSQNPPAVDKIFSELGGPTHLSHQGWHVGTGCSQIWTHCRHSGQQNTLFQIGERVGSFSCHTCQAYYYGLYSM